jgi:tRNA(Ile)-lysidine synthase
VIAVDAAVRAALERFADAPGPATVAASGGLDSTVLARLLVPALRARGGRPRLLCFDHGWRPFEREREHVLALGREIGAPVVLGGALPDPARRRAVGPEAAAREARLGWLRARGEGPIHLGHHRDDAEENALLHGVDLAPAPGRLRRPLLALRRDDLRRWALREGWVWLEDPTNADPARPRNHLRHAVLPSLRGGPELESAMEQASAERLRRARIDAEVGAILPALLRAHGPGLRVLDRATLLACAPAVAAAAVRALCPGPGRGPGAPALSALLASVDEGVPRRHDLGGGWIGAVGPNTLELVRPPRTAPRPRPLAPLSDVRWPAAGRIRRRAVVDARPGRAGLGRDSALLAGADRPLWVVPAGAGRRMRPFGLAGSKRVSDLLREAGISAPRRATWPVVVDAADRVLWVPGARASEVAPLPPGGADATLLLFTDGIDAS